MGKKSKPEPKPEVLIFTLSCGEITVLPTESEEELDQLEKDLYAQFEPASNTEQFLVDRMIYARWKLARVRRLESQAFVDLNDEDGSDSAILDALQAPGNIFDKLDRMAAAAERSYAKAVRELAQLRANAQKAKKQNKAKDAEAGRESELAKIENEPTVGASGRRSDPPVQNEPNSPPEPEKPPYENPHSDTPPTSLT